MVSAAIILHSRAPNDLQALAETMVAMVIKTEAALTARHRKQLSEENNY